MKLFTISIVILFIIGCSVLNKSVTINMHLLRSNNYFTCKSDTTICDFGYELGELEIPIIFSDVRFDRRLNTLKVKGCIMLDSNNRMLLPYINIIEGYRNGDKIIPIRKISSVGQDASFSFQIKIERPETVVYFRTLGYTPPVYEVGKIQ